jgi:predicted PurR-regulated permease PerM
MGGLVYWCFLIFEPFLYLAVLGVVLAVALYPLFSRVESLLGGRRKLAGSLLILVGVGALVVAAAMLSGSFLDGLTWLSEQQQQDALHVPAPPAGVAEWPLIGGRVYETWSSAAQSPGATLEWLGPRIIAFGSWLLATLTGLGVAILLAIVAVVIAGVAMIYAPSGTRMAHGIAGRIAGEQGEASVDLAVDAIRSVATGVLGVATLQAILAAIGLVLADVPAAGLWTVLVLILAVAQLPPLVVLGPAIVYVIATSDSTLTQVLFVQGSSGSSWAPSSWPSATRSSEPTWISRRPRT